MKKKIPTEFVQSDVRKAKANIFDLNATANLKQKLEEGWTPKEPSSEQVENKHDLSVNEERHLYNIATYLVAIAPLAEAVHSLKTAVQNKEVHKFHDLFATIRLTVRNLRESKTKTKHSPLAKVKAAHLHMESDEAREIFQKISNELTPLLMQIMNTADPRFYTEAQNVLSLFRHKMTPQQAGSQINPTSGMKNKLMRKILEKTPQPTAQNDKQSATPHKAAKKVANHHFAAKKPLTKEAKGNTQSEKWKKSA